MEEKEREVFIVLDVVIFQIFVLFYENLWYLQIKFIKII